jgi:hypothetical protein
VPGQLRSSGQLVEVTASGAPAGDHFWVFEGSGRRLLIAPGSNGELVIYDAGSNAFFGRAQRR